MNSVKLQDTRLIHRGLLHFYTLTKKKEEETLRKTDLFTDAAKIMICRNKFNQGGKRCNTLKTM